MAEKSNARHHDPILVKILIDKPHELKHIVAAMLHGMGSFPVFGEAQIGVAPNDTAIVETQIRRAENFKRNWKLLALEQIKW